MKTGICHIVGAAPITQNELRALADEPKKENDLWIAADGGAFALSKAGKCPDLLMGDFDSIAELRETEDAKTIFDIEQWLATCPCERFPPKKDETDLYLAYEKGVSKGYMNFVFWGAHGGRPDHTMANYQMLARLAANHHEGVLVGDGWKVYAVCNGRLELFDLKKGTQVSVFSMSDTAKDITLTGLYYLLEHGELTNLFALGVSNEALGGPATIEVGEGILLVMVNQ